ncbi:MAG TPA: LysM domain-containing protein [Oligoflexia bacterium]|nr:LysM domain-containing protein [Oligoflexia bacterium]
MAKKSLSHPVFFVKTKEFFLYSALFFLFGCSELFGRSIQVVEAKRVTSYANYRVTKPGETLALIAEKTLGSTSRWTAILDANPGLDPKRLKVGTVIRIPVGGRSGRTTGGGITSSVSANASAYGAATKQGNNYTSPFEDVIDGEGSNEPVWLNDPGILPENKPHFDGLHKPTMEKNLLIPENINHPNNFPERAVQPTRSLPSPSVSKPKKDLSNSEEERLNKEYIEMMKKLE